MGREQTFALLRLLDDLLGRGNDSLLDQDGCGLISFCNNKCVQKRSDILLDFLLRSSGAIFAVENSDGYGRRGVVFALGLLSSVAPKTGAVVQPARIFFAILPSNATLRR